MNELANASRAAGPVEALKREIGSRGPVPVRS